MRNPLYSIIGVSLWLMIGSLSAQNVDPIPLGKYKAHPTRILAKYKNPDALAAQSSARTLNLLGVTEKRRFSLVPGLVVFDSNPRIALQSVQTGQAEDQADKLIERITALENSGLFEYVQPSYIYTNRLEPSDGSFLDDTLWGLRNVGKDGGVLGADIDAVRAWDITTGSTNVVVAVIDSGVRYTHRELAAQMWRNPDENPNNGLDDDQNGFVDDVVGMNAVNNTGDPTDDVGHGTHVAGVIGAAANDGNNTVGVAWNVQIMACKVGDNSGILTDDAIRGIDYAVEKGAKVMNASWGGGPFDRALFDSISEAQKKNVLFIAAAGNDANNNDLFVDYPSSYQLNNIISVGALERTDRPAFFSNFGATNVDVFAPGVDIFSTFNDSDSSYQVLSGTSMAAPYVSGIAALILAKFPKALLPELRERIISTAVRIPSLRGRAVSEGRVSAYRALSASADGTMEISVYPPPGNDLLVGSRVTMFVTVTDLAPVTNATVTATYVVGGVTNTINFLNDGAPPDALAGDSTYSAELTVPNVPGDLQLTFTVTAPGKSDLVEVVVYHVTHRPPNDNFETASKIPPTGGLMLGTNRFASMQLNEPKHAKVVSVDASVWWNWSPARSGNAIADTAGSSFDTVVAVYTNSTLRTLREIASVDDVGPNGSRKQGYVEFNAIAGVTYRIAVAGFNTNEVGSIRLRVETGGKPDTNAPTVVVASPSSGLVITNPEPKIVISGVAFDPEPNASGVKEVFVQVNNGLADRAFGSTNWVSTNLLTRGINTIRVSAADYAGNRSEVRTLSVRYAPLSSPNDMFFNALELTGTSGTVTGFSTNATKEISEPMHAGNEGGKSLWWFFRAPRDGVLSLRTISSDFDTLLAIYTGRRVNSLTLVSSNDDVVDGAGHSHINQGVVGGTVYYIAVDGYAGQSGEVQLDYTFTESRVVQITTETPDGGSITPAGGFYPVGTNLIFFANPGPGQEFVGWEGSHNSTDNPLTVNTTSDVRLIARFRDHQPSEGFESGGLSGLPWQQTGSAWSVQSSVKSAGSYAARSGPIGHGQASSLILRNFSMPAGIASFDFKVSSEQNWDFLEFYLNGRRLDRWSGEVGWLTFRFEVPAGQNTLEWRYVKDPVNTSTGEDAAFMDNLELPRQSSAPATAASIHVERLDAGRVQISVRGGAPNEAYAIQVSTDLVKWETLSQAQSVANSTTVLDTTTGSNQIRFYRVISTNAR